MRRAQSQTFEPAAIAAQALKKIEEAYNIEYTYESNRIEGNTLTLQETELVVNEGVTIAGKSMREHLEAINHAETLDYIRDFAKQHDLIFFVSGKKSSNGKMLFAECLKVNPNSHLVDSAAEIDHSLVAGATSIGICGATSTPKWLMEEISEAIRHRI